MNGRDCFGFIDGIERDGDHCRVNGWMLTPSGPPDRVMLDPNSGHGRPCTAIRRADLALAFPGVPGAERGGFAVALGPDAGADPAALHDLVGMRGRSEVGRMTIAIPEPTDPAPLPPADLRQRVSGTVDPRVFRCGGIWNSAEVVAAAARHAAQPLPAHVLEWGCGCGRMTLHLRRLLPHSTITAVDPDAASLGWLAPRAGTVRLVRTAPLPPLPFPPQSFDLVLAVSVFPDLTLAAQELWQQELARMTAPSGRVIVTTLGPLGAALAAHRHATVQSAELTRRVWTRGMRELAHAECVFNRLHDLWVFARE